MQIADIARKTVAFLGIRNTAGDFLPRATAFFVSYHHDDQKFDYLVTAEHVVSGLQTQNHDLWIRVNLENGETAELPLSYRDFYFHPDETNRTDVAVCLFPAAVVDERTKTPVRMDIRFMSLSGERSYLASPSWKKAYLGLGSEIAIIGLFRSHYGKNRNIPILRVGNISAMPDEPIDTEYCGFIDAYLVEARSIAGLSGSPVVAIPSSSLLLARGLAKKTDHNEMTQGAALIGLMHGHFDVNDMNSDVVQDSGPERSVHTGIGVVVPVEKIIETIEHPDLQTRRRTIIEERRLSDTKSITIE